MMLATSYEWNYYGYMCGFAWLGLDVPLSLSCVGPFCNGFPLDVQNMCMRGFTLKFPKVGKSAMQ
jgi:hypothetical protein